MPIPPLTLPALKEIGNTLLVLGIPKKLGKLIKICLLDRPHRIQIQNSTGLIHSKFKQGEAKT